MSHEMETTVIERSAAQPAAAVSRTAVISIVTPCYNEEAGIAACQAAVRAVMEAELPGYSYEHVFIDNCSQDATVAILRGLAKGDRRVKVIVNSRNFGPARSPFHAMLECGGDLVIPVLADLQPRRRSSRAWWPCGSRARRPSSRSAAAAASR